MRGCLGFSGIELKNGKNNMFKKLKEKNMKLAYITYKFPRIYNTFVVHEIIDFINQGYEVHIFSVDNSDEKEIEASKKYNLLKRTTYLDNFKDKRLLNYITYFKYPDLRNATHTINKFSNYLKKNSFDHIHAAFGNRPATIALLASKKSLIPFSFSCHAYDIFVDFKNPKEKITKAEYIRTVSEYNKRYLQKFGKSRIEVKRPFIDKILLNSIKAKKQKKLIVSACRLHPTKGLEYAIKAFNEIKKKEIKYIIIGDGSERKKLQELVKKYKLQDSVIFKGQLSHEKTLEYIKKASVFLLPSVIAKNGDRDATPTVILEAQYMKTPVVSTNISGIPEIIDKNISRLVEPKNIKQIKEAVLKIIQ